MACQVQTVYARPLCERGRHRAMHRLRDTDSRLCREKKHRMHARNELLAWWVDLPIDNKKRTIITSALADAALPITLVEPDTYHRITRLLMQVETRNDKTHSDSEPIEDVCHTGATNI